MPVLPLVGSTSVDLPGEMLPCFFERLDHGDADAVLDAGDRIEEFELEQDVGLDAGFLRQPRHAHQRGVADRLGDRIVDAAAAWVSRFAWDSPPLALPFRADDSV